MSVRVVPKSNWQGLRHSSTSPDLQFSEATTPRRRQSVSELRVPKRKESVAFFASPHRANRRNVTWRATPSSKNNNEAPKKPTVDRTFLKHLHGELEENNENIATPRQPRRQNGMVRLTPTPKSSRKEILVLPRLSSPLI